MGSFVAHHRFLLGAIAAVLLCSGCASKSKTSEELSATEVFPDPADPLTEVAADPSDQLAAKFEDPTDPAAETLPDQADPSAVTLPNEADPSIEVFPEVSDLLAGIVLDLNDLHDQMAKTAANQAEPSAEDFPELTVLLAGAADGLEGQLAEIGLRTLESRPMAGTLPFESVKKSPVEDPCDQVDSAGWLDGTQEWVYESTCRTAAWFDGFFGNGRTDERAGNTFGRVGLSGFWDQRDGFDPKFRFRGTFALPALRDRASLMVGRGDEDEMIDERSTSFDTIPGNFNNIEDDSFLVGLGYTGRKNRGFKISVGAKIRAPPEPYIKLRYRKHFAVTESTMLSLRPIIYWKSEEQLGATLGLDLDHMLKDNLMVRWANYGNVAQSREVEGLEWESSMFLFHALSNRKALTYRVMLLGKTDAEVPIVNYGFEFRFRRRIYREWLFLELLSSATWPQDFLTETRNVNIGVGIGLEMYFGPIPDSRMY